MVLLVVVNDCDRSNFSGLSLWDWNSVWILVMLNKGNIDDKKYV